MKGTVKVWKGGFGFIAPEEGDKDVFVHISALPEGTEALEPGQAVEFEVEETPKGLAATDVKLA